MKWVINCLLLFTIMLSSCRSNTYSVLPKDYVKMLVNPEGVFRRAVITGNKEYQIQLATPEYIAIQEYSEQLSNIDTVEFAKRLDELSGHIFFLIKVIDIDPSESVSGQIVKKFEAEKMAMYYMSKAANDITLLEDGNVKKKQVSYQFENNYSLVAYNTIVVGFEHSSPYQGVELVFNDRYNSNPYIKAKYSETELHKLPGLRFK